MTDERVYLTYILDCIASIQELTAAGRDGLDQSKHDKAAILYYLHTMAEATQKLSEESRASYPEIPWMVIGAFRNRLVHGYLDVNWTIVWEIIEKDLLPLKAAAMTMLGKANQKPDSA